MREDDQRAAVFKAPKAMRHDSQEEGPHSGPSRELLHEDL